jgi:FSR family fosmidomycin resistance protein-like MFS transporter
LDTSLPDAPANPYTPPAFARESEIGKLKPWRVLVLLAATHFLVDIVAGTTNPIWPALEANLSLATGKLLWVYVVWSIATSFSQLLFGWWADRNHSRWLIWCGPLVGILCISCLGLPVSSAGLAVLFAVGGLGIAAFHPEAAATAGALLPQQRSRAMAVFALSGYLGQSAGPFYSGIVADQLGLPGLVYGIAWALPLLLVLCLAFTKTAPPPAPIGSSSRPSLSLRDLPLIGLLLAVGALRILPALGVPLALAYLLTAADASSAVIGAVQSAFMAGIGVGAIGCAAFLKRQWERRAIWIFPLLAMPVLASLSVVDGWWQVALVFVSGFLLGVTMPVYISYGQQLLPHGQRVASSITMGVSWGIGGGIVATAISLYSKYDVLPFVCQFFAAATLMSSALCYYLPTPQPTR